MRIGRSWDRIVLLTSNLLGGKVKFSGYLNLLDAWDDCHPRAVVGGWTHNM